MRARSKLTEIMQTKIKLELQVKGYLYHQAICSKAEQLPVDPKQWAWATRSTFNTIRFWSLKTSSWHGTHWWQCLCRRQCHPAAFRCSYIRPSHPSEPLLYCLSSWSAWCNVASLEQQLQQPTAQKNGVWRRETRRLESGQCTHRGREEVHRVYEVAYESCPGAFLCSTSLIKVKHLKCLINVDIFKPADTRTT